MNKTLFIIISALLAAQVSFGAVKKLLIEDLTGAWCQWCPRGPIEMEKFRAAHPDNVIPITQHGGDKMENVYSKVMYNLAPGYPALMVNRTLNDNLASFASSLSQPAPVAVGITYSWDNATRKITGTVTAKFESAVTTGDIRPGLMIVEHNVVGTGTGYNQANAYNTLNDYPELKGAGNPIVGYKHYMVNRDCALTGTYGSTGIIPNAPVVGTTYSAPFSYTVPAQYNALNVILTNIYLVAFVGYNNGTVINSESVKLNTTTSVKESVRLNAITSPYSVSAAGKAISFNVRTAGSYSIGLYSLSGQRIAVLANASFAVKQHQFNLQNSAVRNGMYIVKVTSANNSSTTRISLTN